jgi:NAD dependent epimerase/dehydratase family enzyme
MTLPAAALRVLFGEVADAAMLVSQRVRPRRLLDSGFAFDHPHLEDGLRGLLG